jgi:hypothetical protein
MFLKNVVCTALYNVVLLLHQTTGKPTKRTTGSSILHCIKTGRRVKLTVAKERQAELNMKKIRNIQINNKKVKAIIRPDATCSMFLGGVKLLTVQGIETSLHDTKMAGLNSWLSHYCPSLDDSFKSAVLVEVNDPLKADQIFQLPGDVRRNAGLPPSYYEICDRVPETWGNDRNGGDYAFWRTFSLTEQGYKVKHFCSSDFDYCDCCGSFDHWSTCPCGGEYRYIDQLPEGAVPIW